MAGISLAFDFATIAQSVVPPLDDASRSQTNSEHRHHLPVAGPKPIMAEPEVRCAAISPERQSKRGQQHRAENHDFG